MEDRRTVNMIVNFVIRPLVLLAVFVAAFLISAGILNTNNKGVTAEMKECTFPTITTVYNDCQMNRMYGYADELQAGGNRGAATLLDAQHKLSIQIQTYGTQVNGISYQVRSLDMERLIEETEVTDFQESDNTINVYLNIQDLLENNQEYQLIICLDTEVDADIYYYTRIRQDGAYYARQNLDFVLDFHNKTCDKASSDAIVKYLESSTEGDNSSFQHVDIHSGYELVTWGDLEILSKDDMDITLQEINNQTAVITLDYMAVLKNSADETEHYDVREYYRVRYTQERMYLLDFERTMNQFFEVDNEVIYSTAVQLGITDSDVSYKENQNGRLVSFVQQGELFAYNSTEHSMAKVFGFWKNGADVRYRNDQHQIQMIDVDEQGNTDFVVYGYMNRGIHEGKVGISVCHYDSVTNSTEEYAFLEYDKSFEHLKKEVEELMYLNHEGKFYVYLQKNIYEIDMNSRTVKELASDMDTSEFAVSKEHTFLVVQEQENLAESVSLIYRNLKEGKEKTITCQENERIRPIGFIGDDFIYGVARAEEITYDSNGQMLFPMYKIIIENSSGEVKKTYEPSGVYVLYYSIRDNVLQLGRVAKSDNGGYTNVSDDQIIHNAGGNKSGITLKSITTEKKKKEYQLDFGFSLPSGKKKILRPKEVLLENVKDIQLKNTQEVSNAYYVYSKGKLDSIYLDAAQAIQAADEDAGVVVNGNQEYVWERIRRQTEQQISGLETISTESGYSSLEASLLSILRYNGKGTDPRTLLAQGMTPYQLLQQELGAENVINMTGTELDKVLYCIDRGYPVLAGTDTGNYVVLIGYNELNTILMDPVKGKTGYAGMNDSRKMFAGAGNIFIACIPE